MEQLWKWAFDIASHTTHPYAVVALTVAFETFLIWSIARAKSRRLRWLTYALIVIAVLGSAPTISFTMLKLQRAYRVHIIVVNAGNEPVSCKPTDWTARIATLVSKTWKPFTR